MSDLRKWRIKTEKEFEDEFGPQWRTEVCAAFPKEMDFLFNLNLSKFNKICPSYRRLMHDFINADQSDYIFELPQMISNWLDTTIYISRDMITEDQLEPAIKKLLTL